MVAELALVSHPPPARGTHAVADTRLELTVCRVALAAQPRPGRQTGRLPSRVPCPGDGEASPLAASRGTALAAGPSHWHVARHLGSSPDASRWIARRRRRSPSIFATRRLLADDDLAATESTIAPRPSSLRHLLTSSMAAYVASASLCIDARHELDLTCGHPVDAEVDGLLPEPRRGISARAAHPHAQTRKDALEQLGLPVTMRRR